MTPLTPAAVMDEQWFSDLRRRLRFESSDDDAPSTILQTMADADEVITILIAERDAARAERDALMVRVDQWRQMADREATAYVEMRAERDAALAERDDARAALQAVEWADMERRCPWCLAYADDNIGHKAYCQRQAALGVGTGEG